MIGKDEKTTWPHKPHVADDDGFGMDSARSKYWHRKRYGSLLHKRGWPTLLPRFPCRRFWFIRIFPSCPIFSQPNPTFLFDVKPTFLLLIQTPLNTLYTTITPLFLFTHFHSTLYLQCQTAFCHRQITRWEQWNPSSGWGVFFGLGVYYMMCVGVLGWLSFQDELHVKYSCLVLSW